MNLSKLFKRTLWFLSSASTLENLPDAVLLVNADGVIEHYNRRAKEIFCFVDNSYGMYNVADVIKDATEIIEKSLALSKPILTKAVIPDNEFYVEINAQKKAGGYCLLVRDMTALTKELFNDDKIRRFNNEKNAMLAKLEDDIKSPISSIAGFSQGLIDGIGGPLNEKQTKYIKIIHNNANDLYTFMDKLLMFSQVESSIYEENIHTFDAVELIKSSSKEIAEELNSREVGFDINSEEIENRNMRSDSNAIQAAFKNILEVAAGMTDKGYVSVKISNPDEDTCAFYDIQDASKYVMLTIRDTGSGIADDDIKYLCEPYAQLSKGKKHFLRSLRLGIASILIKRADGIINIRSEIAKGTKYEIVLPVEKR